MTKDSFYILLTGFILERLWMYMGKKGKFVEAAVHS